MKDEETRCSENLNPLTDKIRKKLSQWLRRDLSLKGRVFLAKAEGLSRLTGAAISSFVSKQICNTADKLLFLLLLLLFMAKQESLCEEDCLITVDDVSSILLLLIIHLK